MTKFIETEDSNGTTYKINVAEIVFIEDTDKYFRTIKLSIVDDNGKAVQIKSIHSIEELNTLINQA